MTNVGPASVPPTITSLCRDLIAERREPSGEFMTMDSPEGSRPAAKKHSCQPRWIAAQSLESEESSENEKCVLSRAGGGRRLSASHLYRSNEHVRKLAQHAEQVLFDECS